MNQRPFFLERIGFGNGYVEIKNVKAAGGIAVAVASDEAERSGTPDAWKRDRLVGVGADLVIPDYRDFRPLLDYLWTDCGPTRKGDGDGLPKIEQ